jgi:hypothetical protein
MWTKPGYITRPVEGTFALVTYSTSSYAGDTVYLHPAGQPFWKGERIGVLGAMTGHGVYATVGTPDIYGGHVPTENMIKWFVGHITRQEAAERMAGIWMDHKAAKAA